MSFYSVWQVWHQFLVYSFSHFIGIIHNLSFVKEIFFCHLLYIGLFLSGVLSTFYERLCFFVFFSLLSFNFIDSKRARVWGLFTKGNKNLLTWRLIILSLLVKYCYRWESVLSTSESVWEHSSGIRACVHAVGERMCFAGRGETEGEPPSSCTVWATPGPAV